MIVLEPVPGELWSKAAREGALVRAPAAASWARSRAHGVDPLLRAGQGAVELQRPGAEVLRRRDAEAPLHHAARATLEGAAAALSTRDVSVLLADPSGVVLDTWAGGAFVQEARRVGLVPGSAWAEAERGTNAIGTALTEGSAVVVRGNAHWVQENHGLVCYAAPIRGPGGAVVGVLDATTWAAAHDVALAAALLAAARCVEACMAAADPATRALLRMVEGRNDAVLLIDPSGRVLASSAQGGRALHAAGADRLPPAVLRAAAQGRAPWSAAAACVWIEALDAGGQLRLVHLEAQAVRAAPLLRAAPRAAPDPFAPVFGVDPRVERLREDARKFARTDLPMLLVSETGTGKDVLARAVHAASARAGGPFVAVNCGALAPSLLESELFGYGPGAFTGALKAGRDGRIAAAHGGTLLLDEIGEMPPALQSLLLRFLEDGSYTRVGEVAERRADVRVIAATSRDLPRFVDEGRFRPDLYYRLRVVRLGIPPLRERTDLIDVARALLAEMSPAPPSLGPEVEAALRAHRWPGNTRELKNALRYAIVAADGAPVLLPGHLPEDVRAVACPAAAEGTLAVRELDAVRAALAAANGNVAAAARKLGVARSTVYRMLERAS